MAGPNRTRATLKVEVDLDDVPGWGNLASDFQAHIQGVLSGTIGHYNPVVTLESCTDPARMDAKSIIEWGNAEVEAGRIMSLDPLIVEFGVTSDAE